MKRRNGELIMGCVEKKRLYMQRASFLWQHLKTNNLCEFEEFKVRKELKVIRKHLQINTKDFVSHLLSKKNLLKDGASVKSSFLPRPQLVNKLKKEAKGGIFLGTLPKNKKIGMCVNKNCRLSFLWSRQERRTFDCPQCHSAALTLV